MSDNSSIIDFNIPNTSEAEAQVIADGVFAPENLGDIIPLVHRDFFTNDFRRLVWDKLVEKYNKGEEIDIQTMSSILGPEFLREITPVMNDAGTFVTNHLSILRNAAAKRRGIIACLNFAQKVSQPATTERDLIEAGEIFTQTIEGPAPVLGDKKIDSVLDKVREEAEVNYDALHQGKNIRISTGFRMVDLVLNGGFKAGQLIILAARPSVGKTALMIQFAKTAALSGCAAQIFSLEMTAEELAERMLFSTEKIRPYDYFHGNIEWRAYEEADSQIRPLPLYINDFSRTLEDITSRLTQAVMKGRCGIAFIDYLGLIQEAINTNGNVKLYQVIARITGNLKALAKRLRIPIVLLCQMNREQVRQDRSPELYDLRDSGSIEQDSDIVFMLQPRPESGFISLWLRKNRAGKKDIQYKLIPNDTYSAFSGGIPIEESGYEIPEDENDLPQE